MRKKLVTLISLPSPFLVEPAMNPGLGLCYIGAALKANGNKVNAIDYATMDYDYSKKDYLNEIDTSSDVYGIYCTSAQFRFLKEVARHLKVVNPYAMIVLGGPQASSQPRESLEGSQVDVVVNGEGEEAMVALVNGEDPFDVPGACFYDKVSKTYIIKERTYIKALDNLASPDFSIFDMTKYKRKLKGDRAFHITTLRGCPYRCHFCDSKVVGNTVRYFSVEKVMGEIDHIIETYGVKNFVIYDDIFTLKKSRVKEFCAEFKKRDIQWRCWSRADLLREEDLILMRQSGLESVAMGVESGDSTILKNINKKTTVEDNRRALLLCKKLGVAVRCSLMFGNPGECQESLDNTVELIRETQPDEWNIAILNPSPGSEFWDNPEEHGLHFDREEIIRDSYQEINRTSDTGMGNIVYSLDSIPDADLRSALKDFVDKLEEVCPRTKIRDTIQNIKIK